jgi:hypothetical protein
VLCCILTAIVMFFLSSEVVHRRRASTAASLFFLSAVLSAGVRADESDAGAQQLKPIIVRAEKLPAPEEPRPSP